MITEWVATDPPEKFAELRVTLLIDGDIIAYMAATAVQETVLDDFGYVHPFANVTRGKVVVDNMLLSLVNRLKATHIKIALSDSVNNWRKSIDPHYKEHRKDLQRPLLLPYLKDHLKEHHGAVWHHYLEADDVLGIWATVPEDCRPPGAYIVVGRDKDFMAIPATHYTIGDDEPASGRPILRIVDEEDADLWHMQQTLAGDIVDGYSGCPGIGMTRAREIVNNPKLLVPEEGVVTRGPRKGQKTTKWMGRPTKDLWACVVSNFQRAGLGEKEALQSARLAYILRFDDHDLTFRSGSRHGVYISLWQPGHNMRFAPNASPPPDTISYLEFPIDD